MDKLNRPDWDEYLMTLAFIVGMKSLDPDTKIGCIVADNENTILSTGYNSPPRGCVDEIIPLTRPEKYMYFMHAEANAINNAARFGNSLRGSTFYVTGTPCHKCLAQMINVGASRIVCGAIKPKCVDDNDKAASELILLNQKIIIDEFDKTNDTVNLINKTLNYIKGKIN